MRNAAGIPLDRALDRALTTATTFTVVLPGACPHALSVHVSSHPVIRGEIIYGNAYTYIFCKITFHLRSGLVLPLVAPGAQSFDLSNASCHPVHRGRLQRLNSIPHTIPDKPFPILSFDFLKFEKLASDTTG